MFYFKRGIFLKATGKLWAFAMEQNNYMYNFPEEALKNLVCLKKY